MLDTQPPSSGTHTPANTPLLALPIYQTDQDVHFLDRLSVLFRYRSIVGTVFLLVVIAMLVQTYTTIPLYRSQARLLIEDERGSAGGLKDVEAGGGSGSSYQASEPYYQTQYRILRGRELARKVVRRLQLQKVPEFNGSGATPTGLGAVVGSVKKGVIGRIRPLFTSKPATAPAADETREESTLVDAFLERVTVTPIRYSRLVDLSFESASPTFAAAAANTLAEEYIQQNLDSKQIATEKTLSWLSDELSKAKQKVEASERALADYRESQNALSLEERQNIVVSRLNQLNDAVTHAKTVRVQRETLYNQLKSLNAAEAPADTFPAVLQNPLVQQQKAQLAELQREKVRLSEKYGEKHPEIVKLNASLADARQRLQSETAKVIESVRNEYRSALIEEQMLAASLESQKGDAMELAKKSVNYTVLERDAQSNRQVYEALLQREKELRVISNSRSNNVRVVDRAEIPKTPFSPDPRRNLFISILLGLGLGIAAALGIDYLDDTIKTPEDITRKLKLPFLGLVPAVRGDRVPVLSGPVPHDFGEAFRALRTSLVFTSGGNTKRIIAVTSAQPLEGKTTTACNLSIALAFGGARVLLIDADMRRPGAHKALGASNDVGLSHLLVGRARAREAIQKTHDPNLWFMAAGRTPPNPSELLASDRMRSLIANLTSGPFDWIIIDTPPVLAVTDAVILGPVVSGVAFVLGAEMTRRRIAERAIETLMSSGPRVLGAVLNRVDLERNKYYYSRFYGYQYKSYYGRATATA
ncbi:MAG: polysaccharide biosynthesis tyrosine autokinase [Acidobacteria bacterium]|nr:polysaccharide biosynthesis tyrosine autokinase [Acidobacteriota bacterium]